MIEVQGQDLDQDQVQLSYDVSVAHRPDYNNPLTTLSLRGLPFDIITCDVSLTVKGKPLGKTAANAFSANAPETKRITISTVLPLLKNEISFFYPDFDQNFLQKYQNFLQISFKNKSQTKHSFVTFVLEISERTLSSLVLSIKLVLNNQTSCITCIITIDITS